jgi:hypothetical protein
MTDIVLTDYIRPYRRLTTTHGPSTFQGDATFNGAATFNRAVAIDIHQAGSANHVAIFDGITEDLTHEAALLPRRGGTGLDTSGDTGIPAITAGMWSVNAAVPATSGGTGIDSSGDTGVPLVTAGMWTVPAQVAPAQGGTGADTSGDTGVPLVTAGAWTVPAQVAPAQGGTGIDTSASTGFPTVNAGTWSVGPEERILINPTTVYVRGCTAGTYNGIGGQNMLQTTPFPVGTYTNCQVILNVKVAVCENAGGGTHITGAWDFTSSFGLDAGGTNCYNAATVFEHSVGPLIAAGVTVTDGFANPEILKTLNPTPGTTGTWTCAYEYTATQYVD